MTDANTTAPAATSGVRFADRLLLDLAARAAYRGAGNVEPNPLVGAVISRPAPAGEGAAGLDARAVLGRVVSIGHHRRFGQWHAEADAINRARQLGVDVRGCVMHVTLEPCSHTGKQPPCVDAILRAGIAEVVIARADPNPVASGGASQLAGAGVRVRFSEASQNARSLSEPFVARLTSSRPWVIAKWAQTIDGRIATRSLESKWISSARSRHRVHQLRSRVDAIITGVGTLIADDPRLTARDVPLRRDGRAALRVVVDPQLRGVLRHLESGRNLLDAAAPSLVITLESSAQTHAAAVDAVKRQGVKVLALPAIGRGEIDLSVALTALRRDFGVLTAMIEAGPRLTGSLMSHGLLDECHVFIAPMIMADTEALGPANTAPVNAIADLARWTLIDHRTIGPDVRLVYRKAERGTGHLA